MTQLTKRESIAAMAMQGLIASNQLTVMYAGTYSKDIAKIAVRYADDLLNQLEKPQDGNQTDTPGIQELVNSISPQSH